MKIPKSYQVKSQILDLIDGLPPESAVPTERVLAEQLDTSRTTVRQAIADLVVDGRLYRSQGRGTFVARPRMMQVRQLTSFSQDLTAEGWRPGSTVLAVTTSPAAPDVAAALGVLEGAPACRVERLRTADDEPLAHETTWLPGPLPGLAEELEGDGSLYAAMLNRYGMRIVSVEDRVQAVLADPPTAQLLKVEPGWPILVVRRTARDDAGRVLEWGRSAFRGDRFSFVAGNTDFGSGWSSPGDS